MRPSPTENGWRPNGGGAESAGTVGRVAFRPTADSPLGQLRDAFPRAGWVDWIGLRPVRREPMVAVEEATAVVGEGLEGDRWRPRPGGVGTRQVTLAQAEHRPVVAALMGLDVVEPDALRRNLHIAGINITALRERRVRVGEVLLAVAGPCEPCSRMEENLGPGGWNAMRGHGGWNAQVLEGGTIRVGDPVTFVPDPVS